MAGNSIRDSQRKRVYRSECTVFHGSPELPTDVIPEYKTVAECQQFVEHVTASDTWKGTLDVRTEGPVEVLDGRGRRSACAHYQSDQIKLPKWTRDRYQVLHELAHIAVGYRHDRHRDEDGWYWEQTVAWHGPEFTGLYLLLVRAFLGEEAHAALVAAFEGNRVKVHHIEPEPASLVVVETDAETPPDVTDDETPRCAECGMVLSTAGTRRAFCCDRCRWTFHNRRRHQRTSADREKVCEACGNEFMATRRDAKTCSPACRQKAYRKRSKPVV